MRVGHNPAKQMIGDITEEKNHIKIIVPWVF